MLVYPIPLNTTRIPRLNIRMIPTPFPLDRSRPPCQARVIPRWRGFKLLKSFGKKLFMMIMIMIMRPGMFANSQFFHFSTRKLITSEPYLLDSPCLLGSGAGASLAARIIAKERFHNNWTFHTLLQLILIISCPQEDGYLVWNAHQPFVSVVITRYCAEANILCQY